MDKELELLKRTNMLLSQLWSKSIQNKKLNVDDLSALEELAMDIDYYIDRKS